MSDLELHKGILIRKVLRGRKKVNILFVPADPTQPALSHIQNYKDEEKRTWEQFLSLSASDHVDIDAGITVLRFKKGKASGIASFFPNSETKQQLHRAFVPTEEVSGGPSVGFSEFNACLDAKRAAAAARNQDFKLVKSIEECLPQMRVN